MFAHDFLDAGFHARNSTGPAKAWNGVFNPGAESSTGLIGKGIACLWLVLAFVMGP